MIKAVPSLASYDRGDGVCKHLDGKRCAIYADRPEVCDVARMYRNHFSGSMSESEFIEVNLAICRQLAKHTEA
jgi:Fe-S-cluster containining protein